MLILEKLIYYTKKLLIISIIPAFLLNPNATALSKPRTVTAKTDLSISTLSAHLKITDNLFNLQFGSLTHEISLELAIKRLYCFLDKIPADTDIIGIGVDHSSPEVLISAIRIIPWLVSSGYNTVGIEHFSPALSKILSDSIDAWIKEGVTVEQYKNTILMRPKFYLLGQYITDMENDLQNKAGILAVNEYLLLLKYFRKAHIKIVPIDTRHFRSQYNNNFVHFNTNISSAKLFDTYLKKNKQKKAAVLYGFSHLWRKYGDNIRETLEKLERKTVNIIWLQNKPDFDISIFQNEDTLIRINSSDPTTAFINFGVHNQIEHSDTLKQTKVFPDSNNASPLIPKSLNIIPLSRHNRQIEHCI